MGSHEPTSAFSTGSAPALSPTAAASARACIVVAVESADVIVVDVTVVTSTKNDVVELTSARVEEADSIGSRPSTGILGRATLCSLGTTTAPAIVKKKIKFGIIALQVS